jgi:hypothetical protein
MQRALIGTTIALLAISILVRVLLLPMVSHGRDLYFTTFASTPFPGL